MCIEISSPKTVNPSEILSECISSFIPFVVERGNLRIRFHVGYDVHNNDELIRSRHAELPHSRASKYGTNPGQQSIRHMGSILYELATGDRLFRDDFAAFMFTTSAAVPRSIYIEWNSLINFEDNIIDLLFELCTWYLDQGELETHRSLG
jgi:hypothetical protein